jgi:hypothetical protein
MSDYEKRLKEERAALNVLNLKVIKALNILGITATIDKEYRSLDVGKVPSLEHQVLWIRTNHVKKKGTIEVNLSYANAFRENYLDKDQYQRIGVNIASTKTAEVIAADIKRRVIESAQARDNEAYLIGVKFRNEDYKNRLEAGRTFMSKSGIELNGKDKANHYEYRQGNSLDITVSSGSDLGYYSVELKGLTESQWLKVFALTNEIITESNANKVTDDE